MKRAHVKLGLGGLSTTLQLTPGDVRHPLLISIESESEREPELVEEPEPSPRRTHRALDRQPPVDDEIA